MVTGFTSFVSHAGGPPFQMYAVPLRLSPRIFAGTSVIMFAVVNAVKLVPYFLLGQFDVTNLETSAVLLPVSIPATFLGIWLVKVIDAAVFYRAVYVLIFVVGVYLVWEGAGRRRLTETPARPNAARSRDAQPRSDARARRARRQALRVLVEKQLAPRFFTARRRSLDFMRPWQRLAADSGAVWRDRWSAEALPG